MFVSNLLVGKRIMRGSYKVLASSYLSGLAFYPSHSFQTQFSLFPLPNSYSPPTLHCSALETRLFHILHLLISPRMFSLSLSVQAPANCGLPSSSALPSAFFPLIMPSERVHLLSKLQLLPLYFQCCLSPACAAYSCWHNPSKM